MKDVSDTELLQVIKDFLEMGHVDNIVAMFYREPHYLKWTAKVLDDERFNVRLGVSVLFEELSSRHAERLDLAIPGLLELLHDDRPLIRGEALSVLAIIDGPDLRSHTEEMLKDQDPQVREIAIDIVESM